jgi:hypothetical protein
MSQDGPVMQSILPSPSTVYVCNLAEGNAYAHRYDRPHVPVAAAFGAGRLHQIELNGKWDLQRAVADHHAILMRSVRFAGWEKSQDPWDDLTFCYGPKSYLYADPSRIVGYAETPEEAEALVVNFKTSYALPVPPTGGSFYLIKTGSSISIERVPLGLDTVLTEEVLDLHYGEEAKPWREEFLEMLNAGRHGLSILEGPPGTGKTSFLRHIMGCLAESHRFYFIPPATLSVLSSPDFIGFWASQRQRHEEKKMVVILEDADALLLQRGADNRDQVSGLLNLTDGMLADFLRLHIICTMNGQAANLDAALLRPGRLRNHRVFPKLRSEQAQRVADSIGRVLPHRGDYSLAEVFSESKRVESPRQAIGFTS